MKLTDFANTAFSSGLSIDKVCAIIPGTQAWNTSDSVLGGYLYQKAIPHSFTRPVLTNGLFSDDNSNWVPSGSLTSQKQMWYNLYSDSNNIYLLWTPSISLPVSGSFYYKVIGTWMDNYDTTNPLITPRLTTTSSYYFDSRKNYQKIFKQDMVTANNPGVDNTGNTVIPHNLGYIPNFKMHFESLPGQVWPAIMGGANDIWLYDSAHQYECWGIIDNTNLTIYYKGGPSSASTLKIWYRIYYDS